MWHKFMTSLFSLAAGSQRLYFLVNVTGYFWVSNRPFLTEGACFCQQLLSRHQLDAFSRLLSIFCQL